MNNKKLPIIDPKLKAFAKDLLPVLEKHHGYIGLESSFRIDDVDVIFGISGVGEPFYSFDAEENDCGVDASFVKGLLGGDIGILIDTYSEILEEFNDNKNKKDPWFPKLYSYCGKHGTIDWNRNCTDCLFKSERVKLQDSNGFTGYTSYACAVMALKDNAWKTIEQPEITQAKKAIENTLKKAIKKLKK